MLTRTLVLYAVLAGVALGSLAGCGKKGELDPPQPREVTKEKPHKNGN